MIIFVADAFVEDYVGGAELTTEALIDKCLLPYKKFHSQNVTIEILKTYRDAFWVFGNTRNLSKRSKLFAINNLNYSVLEYDYKFCSDRLPELHEAREGECNCHIKEHGKLEALFLYKSKINWWMSEKQRDIYCDRFPFLQGEVLSSVFSDGHLSYLSSLETSNKSDTWIILNSASWVKGSQQSIQYAEANNLKYELVWGLDYKELLKKMASAKGIIFLPQGSDTCPRFVIEAKLLDCEVVINDFVQHRQESWFQNKMDCFRYLSNRALYFWEKIESMIEDMPFNSQADSDNQYLIVVPFHNVEKWITKCIESIKMQSYKNFNCVLIDDASTDKTVKIINKLIKDDSRFKLIKREKNIGALANIWDAVLSSSPRDSDIIVNLDGDDWFSSQNVLQTLNSYYTDECLMTYGSHVTTDNGKRSKFCEIEVPSKIIDNNLFRESRWMTSALRTFRYSLWKRIDIRDLKDAEGKFYTATWDMAYMFPMLEMAGHRSKFVSEILYIYNLHDSNDHVIPEKRKKQLEFEKEIRNKKKYNRL